MGRSCEEQRPCRRGATPGWSSFEGFGAAAHVLTDEGLIVEANPAFERMFGAPRGDFYGRHAAELCAGAGPVRHRIASRMLEEAFARGSWRGTLRNRGSDGRRFTTRAHVYPTSVRGRLHYVCIQEETGGAMPTGGGDPGAAHRWARAAPG